LELLELSLPLLELESELLPLLLSLLLPLSLPLLLPLSWLRLSILSLSLLLLCPLLKRTAVWA
jgi:hypothetical protein